MGRPQAPREALSSSPAKMTSAILSRPGLMAAGADLTRIHVGRFLVDKTAGGAGLIYRRDLEMLEEVDPKTLDDVRRGHP